MMPSSFVPGDATPFDNKPSSEKDVPCIMTENVSEIPFLKLNALTNYVVWLASAHVLPTTNLPPPNCNMNRRSIAQQRRRARERESRALSCHLLTPQSPQSRPIEQSTSRNCLENSFSTYPLDLSFLRILINAVPKDRSPSIPLEIRTSSNHNTECMGN